MKLAAGLLLFIQACISLELAWSIFRTESSNRKENAVQILNMLMVAIWNISYLLMFNSGDAQVNLRYACRNIGMLSSILAVVFCHYILMQGISMNHALVRTVFQTELILGLLVYPLAIARESVEFAPSVFGWSYRVVSYPGRGVYDLYCIGVELVMLIMALYGILRGRHRREKIYGINGIVYVAVMGCGMVLGTVKPITGDVMFPWSASAMTICVILNYMLTVRLQVSTLTVSNVSPQIFNRIDTPMLVTDEEGQITLMNRAAGLFLKTSDDRIIEHRIQDFFSIRDEVLKSQAQSFDATCTVNQKECRLRLSRVTNVYHEPLGTIYMITDLSDKIEMITELESYRNHLQEKLDLKTKELEALTLQAISAVANTIDAKDEYTKGHSVRVAHYAAQLAKKLGKDEAFVNNLHYMALLHDIGKIGVPDSVLNKAGRLNETEFGLIKQHTVIGAEILKDITMVEGVALGAKYHHEKYNGTGYPSGLKGTEIPYEARIIGIADAFDAMTSNRVYRRGLPIERVIQEFEKGIGTQFDPDMTPVFIDLVKSGELKVEDQDMELAEKTIISEGNQLLRTIMERRNEQIREEADFDYLTKLHNRKFCEQAIERVIAEKPGILLLIDLDHFKEINDSYGHLMGDVALKDVADYLKEHAPEGSILGRQGGDEFMLFLPQCGDQDEALKLAHFLAKTFESMSGTNDILERCTLSIGVSMPSKQDTTYKELFRQADKALYHVKETGRGKAYAFHTDAVMEELPVIRRDLSHIVKLLRHQEHYKGAFPVEMHEVQRQYEFAKSFAMRYRYEMQLVLFTIEWDYSSRSLEDREEVMRLFQTAVKNSLRTVDISTRYGSSQMMVVLMDASDAGVSIVANKIISHFYKIYTGHTVEIYYDSINARDI